MDGSLASFNGKGGLMVKLYLTNKKSFNLDVQVWYLLIIAKVVAITALPRQRNLDLR